MAGLFGRHFDEKWKFQSLTNSRENQALESALAMVLPGLEVEKFERLAETGGGDVCRLRVKGRRARLTSLADRQVAMCQISVPSIPVRYYREKELGEEFTFSVCPSVSWTIRVVGDQETQFCGFSSYHAEDFGFGRAVQVPSPEDPERSIDRYLEVSRRSLKGESLDRLPSFFQKVEDFCRVVLVFS
jgi:hypothetical protein